MSNQKINLRLCKFPNDLSGIMQIERASFGAEAFPVIEFLTLYAIGRETFWVVEREEKIVAYLSAYIEDEYACIASIAVSPQIRRQGIGKLMIEKLINSLNPKPNIKGIILQVRQSNQSAIALYKQFNFVKVKLIPDYYPDGETGIEMKLDFAH